MEEGRARHRHRAPGPGGGGREGDRSRDGGGSGSDGDGPPRSGLLGRGGGRTLLWILLAVAAFYLGRSLFTGAEAGPTVPYTTFRGQLEEGNVIRVEVKGPRIRGVLQAPDTLVRAAADTVAYTRFTTFVPSFGDDALMADLEERGVEVRTRPPDDGGWLTVLLLTLPFLLLLFLGWRAARGMGGRGSGIFKIGKAKARLYDAEEDEQTRFDDVAGSEGAKEELREIMEYLRDPARFEGLGGEMPTGVILVGPPGTGKTLLARAVAGEAGVPFYSITGSDFMEMFVGVGAKRVRDLFQKARKAAPAIVFIDEIDSIGRTRGAGLGGGHDEREQTLNQLLSELDGFEPTENVVVMAATNRPDILDPALLRPGRFDRKITVHLPTAETRHEILRLHAKDKPLHPDVDLEELARGTPGLSGADLENLLNEAALLAARRDSDRIETRDLEEARDKVLMGREREGMALTDDEKELLAYHEAGHAVVAAVLPRSDPLHKVSIIPRGKAMGVTQQLPEKERYIYEKDYMLDRLTVMMGGRAAEALALDTATSGAEDDLRQATKLARKMVMDWGMSDEVGLVSPGGRQEQVFLGQDIARKREFSEETAREVDAAVEELVESSYRRARGVLEEHRDVLEEVVRLLTEEEEVKGRRVAELLERTGRGPGDGDASGAAEEGEAAGREAREG